MVLQNEVLSRAADYDFNTVRAYLEQGGTIDIYDRYGRGLLASLLRGYYKHAFYTDPNGKKWDIEAEENKNAIYYSWTPLEERPHSIKEQIDYLFSKGIHVNDIGWKEAKEYQKNHSDLWVEVPLYFTVRHRDYCMTKYLLEHGADPDIRFSFDEEDEMFPDVFDKNHWLLDDLDIAIVNGDCAEAMELLHC